MTEKLTIKDVLISALKSIFTRYLKWVFLIFGTLYALSGFYKIDRNEIGVVVQFGKVVEDRVMPGLHYTLPFNTLHKVSVKEIQTQTIDRFSTSFSDDSLAAQFKRKTGINPYIITGDNNIVTIKLLVKYKVTNPYNYLFTVRDATSFLSPLAAASLVTVFASQTIDSVLTYGKKQVEQETKSQLQQQLDTLETGLSVAFIEIQNIAPPKQVNNYFNDVINARMDRRKMVNEARSYKNEAVPLARTRANRAISSAQSDANEMILKSEGEAEAFLAKLTEYKKDKESAKIRYYIDFMNKTIKDLKEVRIIQSTNR